MWEEIDRNHLQIGSAGAEIEDEIGAAVIVMVSEETESIHRC